MGTWNEALHRRDSEGQFTHSSISAWAEAVSKQMSRSVAEAARVGLVAYPPGHFEAMRRARELWDVPDMPGRTERTDAEHAELMQLMDAFDAYVKQLGLKPNPRDRGAEVSFVDDNGDRFNEYGEPLNQSRGYSRSPSVQVRMGRQMRRSGELRSGDPTDWETRFAGRGEVREGRLGYGARADVHDDEGLIRAAAFVAAMKRVQARGRQENVRTPKRRTPRGTQVEGWMDQASAQLARRSGRG